MALAGVAGVPELAGDRRHKAGHDGWADDDFPNRGVETLG